MENNQDELNVTQKTKRPPRSLGRKLLKPHNADSKNCTARKTDLNTFTLKYYKNVNRKVHADDSYVQVLLSLFPQFVHPGFLPAV